MDNKQRLVIAHVLHSRAMLVQAPVFVLRALSEWIGQLEKGTEGNVEQVSVADSVSVELIDKKEGKVQ